MNGSVLERSRRTSFVRYVVIAVGWILGTISFATLSLSTAAADEEGSTDPSPLTKLLCRNNQVPCAIQIGSRIREGSALTVNVTGTPSTSTTVRLFRLDLVGGQVVGMKPMGERVLVDLNESGFGTARVPVEPLAIGAGADSSGGWAFIGLADASWNGDPQNLLGEAVPLDARVPVLLGDGYGTEKPVASVLDLEFTNFIEGTEFVVEYQGDDGSWHNVTRGFEVRNVNGERKATVRYAVPNGLASKHHRFRLHNVTDPSAVDPEWLVQPVQRAVPMERQEIPVLPEFGGAIDGTSISPLSSARGATGYAVVALVSSSLIVVLLPAFASRRRRLDWGSAT